MRKRISLIAFMIAAVLLITPCLAITVYGASDSPLLSPGLLVIAEDNSMAKAALVGKEIVFSHDDFARAMNLSKIDSITITKIPPIADGELRLGNDVLTGGETIRTSKLSALTYVQSKVGVTCSSFEFVVNESAVPITCMLYHLDKTNGCPTIGEASELYLNVSTSESTVLLGKLPASDPEGDKITIEIVSYPKSGLIELTNKNTGEYKFTPASGFSGKDEFSYVARDIYGNYSASKTVEISVG